MNFNEFDSRIQFIRHRQQRRHAHRGDQAILSVAGRRSELDASGHESIAAFRTRLCTALCHRILKLARTIADLAESDEIQSTHLAEALQYMSLIY